MEFNKLTNQYQNSPWNDPEPVPFAFTSHGLCPRDPCSYLTKPPVAKPVGATPLGTQLAIADDFESYASVSLTALSIEFHPHINLWISQPSKGPHSKNSLHTNMYTF
jgi:hypothetical protein